MPELFRFLLRHAAIGFSAAAALTAIFVYGDLAGFGTVVRQSDMGLVACALVVYFLGLTFTSVQIGFAIMTGQTNPDEMARVKALRKRPDGRAR